MKNKTVEFYFDYLSPYAYFVSLRLDKICAQNQTDLVYRPILLAGLLNHWGNKGPVEIEPKRISVGKHCYRYAALNYIKFLFPKTHPFRPLTALRVSLPEVSGSDQKKVIETLWRWGWSKGNDMGEDAEIINALNEAGLDGFKLVENSKRLEIKERLKSETQKAIENDVFGVPTMIIDHQLFWGLDQLDHFTLYLAGQDPLAQADPKTLHRPQAAHR